MKRLLLVSYYFPPHLVPESLLVARTAKSLARFGWDITVLTNREKVPRTRTDYSLLASMPSSLTMRRIGGFEHLFPFGGSGIMNPFGLPEVEFLWILSARFAGNKLLHKNTFDIIHSWATCHTSNIVGLLLKRDSGLPWVAHFSDPWVDNPYFSFNTKQSQVIKHLEEAVIREADAVVFTTDETVEMVMSKYPVAWQHKAKVISHGYDADFSSLINSKPLTRERIRIVYTGSFYGKRSPEFFLHALMLLQNSLIPASKFDVIFVGEICKTYQDMSVQLGLSDNVSFTGSKSFIESLKFAASADVLLVIDAPNSDGSVFLPSKLVDYLMFEKPILGLTPKQGASANLLRELGCLVVEPDDVEGIVDTLKIVLEQWEKGYLVISENFKDIAQRYHIDQTTRKLENCFDICLAQ